MTVRNPVPISAGSISTASIENKSVTAPKLSAPTAQPAKGAENSVTVGASAPCQKVPFTIVGNNAETKFKVKHSLETRFIDVELQKSETELPGEGYFKKSGAGKESFVYKAISLSEVEVVFGTAPGAAEIIYGNVTG